MGHLINPVSLRLSVNSFWDSTWVVVNNFNFVSLFKKDYILFHFLNWFIKKSKFIKFNLLISHYKIYRVNQKIYINLYYYNSNNIVDINTNYFDTKSLGSILTNEVSDIDRFKNLYDYIFKVLIFNLYWRVLNSTMFYYFNKLNNSKELFYLNVYSLSFLNITVDSIANYISLKLQKKYTLNWILKPILKDLTTRIKQKHFLGYKIVCSGRFTRKQIATYMWMRKGSLKLGNISNLIKYSETRVRLKYGLCGIKIWLNYGCNNDFLIKRNLLLVFPLHVPFKYVLDKNSNTIILYLNTWFFFFVRIVSFKLQTFIFYKWFIIHKIKNLLIFLFEKVKSNFSGYYYNINLLNNNSLQIKLLSSDSRTKKDKNTDNLFPLIYKLDAIDLKKFNGNENIKNKKKR